MILSSLILTMLVAVPVQDRRGAKPPPTHRNVSYGPHERNVIDFWKAKSKAPAPLVVYIHGGGFRGGNKKSINAGTLQGLLAGKIHVAAIHYRLIDSAKLPAAHHDSRIAIQFLRSKTKEWNIDKGRLGAFGGSAGAQICMWLAFHDEMAEPDHEDPIRRESSRLTCVATNGGHRRCERSDRPANAKLDVVYLRTFSNRPKRKRISRLKLCVLACLNHVSDFHAVRSQDVAPVSVGILYQGYASRPVRIVLDSGDFAGNPGLVTLKVDYPVAPLVTTAPVTDRDPPL